MKNRQRIRVKAPSQSAVPPIQVKSLQSRPFAPTPNPATQQQSVPSIQAQLDSAKRFGYDLSNISIFHTTSAAVQPKLTIGQPGDKSEQGADQVATHMVNRMNMPASQTEQAERVQRKESLDEANKLQIKGMVQRYSDNEEDKMPSKNNSSEDTKAPTSTPVARVGLHTDVESLTRIAPTLLELVGHRLPGREGGVGHSWISLQYNPQSQVPDNLPVLSESLEKLKNGEAVNFGFYPSDNDNKKMAIQSVQGYVQELDNFHTAKASKYFDVGQEQINAILKYVESQRDARYNICNFQCTHFALGALRSAGISVPTAQGVVGGKTFVLPNGLYKDLTEMAFKLDTEDQNISLREDSVELQYGPDVSDIGITKSTISILKNAVRSYSKQKGVMTQNQEDIFNYLNQDDIGDENLGKKRKKALKKLGFETGANWFSNIIHLVGGVRTLDLANSKSIEARFQQVEATRLKIGQKMQLMTFLVKNDAGRYASRQHSKNP